MSTRFSFAQFFTSVTVVLVAASGNSANAGLVQYWAFDDGVGTSAANQIVGGNTGVLTNFDLTKINNGGSDTPPSDWVGTGLPVPLTYSTGALDFDSGTTTGDFVDGGAINLSSTGSGGVATVSMWLKPTALNGDDRLFGQNGTTLSSGEGGAPHVLANGQVEIWNGAAWQVAAPPGTLAVGTWTHLAFVWDTGSVATYANGTLANTVVSDFDFLGAGHEFGIGNRFRSTNGTTFDGVFDDVSIWDIALTAEKAADLAAGISPNELFPVPEPSSFLLLGLGALGLVRHTRRRRRRA